MSALQGFLGSVGAWALVPIFLVVTLESSAFLGLLFPGEMVALIAGALAAAQAVSPWLACATVATAPVLGDLAGYALAPHLPQPPSSPTPLPRRPFPLHRCPP